jgi:glucose/mannose transport system substrate-binding protein
MEPDVQVGFALNKGTIPTRTDVDASSLSACAQYASKTVKDPSNYVYDDSYSLEPSRLGALQDLSVRFWNSKDMTVDQFISSYADTLTAQM